jgi:sugar/nucleoside kinase (ribokinase family)
MNLGCGDCFGGVFLYSRLSHERRQFESTNLWRETSEIPYSAHLALVVVIFPRQPDLRSGKRWQSISLF